MASLKKKIFKTIFGEISVSGDLLYLILFSDQNLKYALIGAIPIPGTSLIHLMEGGDEDEDNNSSSGLLGNEDDNSSLLGFLGGRDEEKEPRQNSRNQSRYQRYRNRNSNDWSAAERRGEIQKPDDSGGISLPGDFNIWSIVKLVGIIGLFGVGAFFVMSLIGGGAGYLDIFGTAFGAEASAARDAGGGLFSGLLGGASNAAETGTCLASAGCFQEFLLNQSTVGAGGGTSSKNTGDTFDLRIENLRVEGQQNEIPLRIYDPDYNIPISFTLKNERQGQYGIEASNIDYKVNIYDPGVTENQEACTSGWLDLEKGGGEFGDTGDLLVPGESATPLNWQEDGKGEGLNLANCGLLQPGGFKDDRLVEVAAKYDYATTATLKARGMSRSYLNDESGIDNSEPARSKAPDTPVRTYFVLTREPFQFFNASGELSPISERALFGIQTKKDNIGYQLQDFTLIDSSKTRLEDIAKCKDLQEGEGENEYKISGDKWTQIQNEQDDIWLNDNTGSITQMRCKFQLKEDELEDINPTGEELLFTVRSEYKVKSYKEPSSFSIINRECSKKNCQMVKPLTGDFKSILSAENPKEDKYWQKRYATCKDWDDEEGCSIRENGFKDSNTADKTIEDGEIAVEIDSLSEDMLSCEVEDTGEYAGIDEDELKESLDGSKVLNNMGGDWEAVSKEDTDCGGGKEDGSEEENSGEGSSGEPACSEFGSSASCPNERCFWNAMSSTCNSYGGSDTNSEEGATSCGSLSYGEECNEAAGCENHPQGYCQSK